MGVLEDRLWKEAGKAAKGRTVIEVVRGQRYTAVLTDEGRVGLAYSFAHTLSGREDSLPLLLRLPLPASELLALAASKALVDRAVALATANALLPISGELSNALPPVKEGEKVLLVGYMEPIALRLKEKGVRVLFLDDQVKESLPLDRGPQLAASVDHVVLTASAIINRTWESFIERARDCWVVGPSAPLFWPIYEGTSVSVALGRTVRRAEDLLRIITRGAGTRFFDPFTEKVFLTRENA